jgi:poly(A) polymerase
LRGLTAVPGPSGRGEVLLAAVEGTTARILRIDPATGQDATDLDLRDFLVDAWRVQVDYIIAAYNDMAKIRDGVGSERLVIGLEAFIPPRAQMPVGHLSLSVGYGRLDGGAWYLVRDAAGHYELHQVTAMLPTIGTALVATRSILASPFPGDGDGVYFAGYDANKAAAHNTAWIVRGKAAAIFGGR